MSDLAKLVVKANTLKTRIAKDRDDLRDLIGELEEIQDDSDEVIRAIDELNRAADGLSKFL